MVCARLGRNTMCRLIGLMNTCVRLRIRRRHRCIVRVVIMNVLVTRRLRMPLDDLLKYRLTRYYDLVNWLKLVRRRCMTRYRRRRCSLLDFYVKWRIRCRRTLSIVDGLLGKVGLLLLISWVRRPVD